MVKNVFQDRTVLVTGHTGFIGSWLTLWLNHLGANVIGYSLEPWTEPNIFNSLGLRDRITHIEGDVISYTHLSSVFRDYRPEFVFHLAAQSIVRQSYKFPKLFYETNVMGTVNILECLRSSDSVKNVVVFTSDKCYENVGLVRRYTENDALGGRDPYSSSKACAELVTRAYRDSFDLLCIISSVRAGNVVGGGDWSIDRLVPDFVRALQNNQPIVLRNPNAYRPWQFVLDAVYGLLLLSSAMDESGKEFGGAWNFSMDSSCTTVEALVKKLISCWGGGKYVVDASPQPHEDMMLNLDSSKSNTLLNWHPVFSVDDMVERTVDWYKKFYQGTKDMYAFSVNEIKKYGGI